MKITDNINAAANRTHTGASADDIAYSTNPAPPLPQLSFTCN